MFAKTQLGRLPVPGNTEWHTRNDGRVIRSHGLRSDSAFLRTATTKEGVLDPQT